jgi:prolyl-tRNA synthetase
LGSLRTATPEEIRALTGADAGYISPIGLSIKSIADESLRGGKGFVTGANIDEYHFKGVNIERDVKVETWLDIEVPNPGDPCIECGNPLQVEKTIEVGHIFNLGTRYSIPVGAFFIDCNGEMKPIIMGSYGIGVERVMAAIVETHYDNEGIIWPDEVAPYKVIVIPLDMGDTEIRGTAERIWSELDGYTEVLIDDRDESPGVKFKDALLIGIPWQVVVGKRSIGKGEVEIKKRTGDINKNVKKERVKEELLKWIC